MDLGFGNFTKRSYGTKEIGPNEIFATDETSQGDVFISEMWRFLPNEGYRFNRIVVPNETAKGIFFCEMLPLERRPIGTFGR